MARNSVGGALNDIMRLYMNNERIGQQQERLNQSDKFQQERIDNQRGFQQAQLLLNRLRLQQTMNANNLKAQGLAEKKREFDAAQNNITGGMSMPQYRAFEARKAGLPYTKVDDSGKAQGTYKMPTMADQSKLEQVVNAWPQLEDLLSQIKQGSKYFMNKPDQFKKYTAALSAAWTGNASPAQEKILEQVGITQNAITQAAETQSRIMQVAKTDTTYQDTRSLFQPKEGETLQSYQARINGVMADNARRFYQAQLQLQDVPLDPVAQNIQNQTVNQELAQDPMLSMGENTTEQTGMNINNVYYTNDMLNNLASNSGKTREQVITSLGG